MQLTVLVLYLMAAVMVAAFPSESEAAEKKPVVIMETSLGSVKIELDQENGVRLDILLF